MVDSRTVQTWKWISTITFFIAAFMVASNTEYVKWSFVLFALGHLVYSIMFSVLKDYPMATQGIGFLILDLWGIYNWILK
jgi:hypothetical protein